MKKNRLYLLIFIILFVIAAILYLGNSNVTLKKELRDFAVEDTASVSKIYLVNKNNQEVFLERKENNLWWVNEKYPARKESIDLILKTLNRVRVRAPVSKSARENVITMLAGRNVKVEIYKGNKLHKVFYVGGATQDQRGTYMLMEGSSAPFIGHIEGFSGYLSSRFFIDEELWRDPGIYRYRSDDIKSVTLLYYQKPEQSFKINRISDKDFNIEPLYEGKESEPFDTLAVRFYTTQFKNISWEFLASEFDPVRKDSIVLTSALFTITVEDVTGKNTSVTSFLKPADGKEDMEGNILEIDNERMFALLNDEEFFVIVQYHIFDKVIVDYDSFLEKNNSL